MRTQSQGDSSNDFIIDRPKRVIRQKPKGTSHAVRTPQQPQQSWNLQKAANAPGQKKVSDYYFVDPMDINNVSYLLDLVNTGVPQPVCIVISDGSQLSLEGPKHVSSPSSDTQVFEYPNLLPIASDIKCIAIADSE